MSSSRRISPRLLLVGSLVVYLIADLSVHGPVGHRLALLRPGSPESAAKAKAEGAIARVHDQWIYRSQVDRMMVDRSCSEADALDQLIVDELLRRELKESPAGRNIQVRPEEVDEALKRFRLKFESQEALKAALEAEGFGDENSLRELLEANLRLEKFLRAQTEADSGVTDAAARAWFDQHASELANPERLQARQVFLATLDRDPAEARQKLDAALTELTGGKKDFATLVKELSEDDGSKSRAGDLGWMTRDRLPAEFVLPLFSMEPGKPTILRTKLGWHLVEVTAKKPSSAADFEAMKPEIVAALSARQRTEAIKRYRDQLRSEATSHIEVFGGK